MNKYTTPLALALTPKPNPMTVPFDTHHTRMALLDIRAQALQILPAYQEARGDKPYDLEMAVALTGIAWRIDELAARLAEQMGETTPSADWEVSEREIERTGRHIQRHLNTYLSFRYCPDPAARHRADWAKDELLAACRELAPLVTRWVETGEPPSPEELGSRKTRREGVRRSPPGLR